MKSRYLIFILALSSMILSSCVSRSVQVRENDEHKKNTIRYCGGQLWGYIEPISKELPSRPYVAVYTQLTTFDKKEALLLNIAFNFRNSAKVKFQDKKFYLKVNDQNAESKTLNFSVTEGFKRIPKSFQSDSYVVESTEKHGEYLIYKKKYGGFFGQMPFALEKPIKYTTPQKENIELKADSHEIVFDPEIHEEFYILAIPILFMNQNPKYFKEIPEAAKLEITLPKIEIDGTAFNIKSYIFNFDRKKIMNAAKNSYNCPSLEMMFHWGRQSFSVLPNFIID